MIRSMTASTKSVRFAPLPGPALAALADGDLDTASAVAGVTLTPYFIAARSIWLWRLRIDQIAVDPPSAGWIARAAVDEPGGMVVGYAGFHGPPDPDGMVEVGYAVDPAYRRQGYAVAMLGELLARAAREPGVKVVRASISPDNAGSLATVAHYGFAPHGDQWDEEDGLELIFERTL